MGISKEGEEILKRMEERRAAEDAAIEKFWKEEFPMKTLEEKISYWTGQIHREMRWQGESTGDEYGSGFTQQWFDECQKLDPDFGKIFPIVAQRLNIDSRKISLKIK